MHNVITLLRNDYEKRDGTRSVVLQLYIHRKRVVLPTSIEVSEDYWDDEKKLVTSKHPKAKDYNMIIERCRSQVNEILIKYRLAEKEITPARLRIEFQNQSNSILFNEWMRKEILTRKGLISSSTGILHNSVLNSLESFQGEVLFSEMDNTFLERFENHLKNSDSNKINTISKKMRTIRSYINRARGQKIIRDNPFDGYKIKKGKGRIIYLEEFELNKLIDLYSRDLVPKNMKKVLKYFLFACFTGLRISDVKRLHFEQIVNDIIILIPTKKINTDHETVTIPLCKSAKKLVYEDNPHRIYGKVFDTYTDQVTNRYLKDIVKLKNIKKHITFHSARHTFATLFLEKTNDLASLQKLLGHSSINQTMIYAHVSEAKKREQIKVFDDLL